jgi:hypothetical protein
MQCGAALSPASGTLQLPQKPNWNNAPSLPVVYQAIMTAPKYQLSMSMLHIPSD